MKLNSVVHSDVTMDSHHQTLRESRLRSLKEPVLLQSVHNRAGHKIRQPYFTLQSVTEQLPSFAPLNVISDSAFFFMTESFI